MKTQTLYTFPFLIENSHGNREQIEFFLFSFFAYVLNSPEYQFQFA